MNEDEFEAAREAASRRIDERRACNKDWFDPKTECCFKLDCGGWCFLSPGHEGEHACVGDIDGPGSCPA